MAPPSMPSVARSRGFDFSRQMWELCHDATQRLPELQHIRMTQVAVTFCQTRKRVMHGLQAKLTPLRFQDGRLVENRGGRQWTVQRLFDPAGVEMLYILSFYLPRFMDQTPKEKLTTIFHELWHISPRFDGDLRRFPGRCYAHSARQRDFDALASDMAQKWLDKSPPEALFRFLWLSFQQLQQSHGRIYGLKVRTPKIIPVARGAALPDVQP